MPPDLDAGGLQSAHERDGRGSANVLRGRAPLEGEARDEDLGAGGGAAEAAELVDDARGHVVREGLVDLPGLFDDPGLEIDLLQAVDQDEGVLLQARPAHEAGLGDIGSGIVDVGGADHLGR